MRRTLICAIALLTACEQAIGLDEDYYVKPSVMRVASFTLINADTDSPVEAHDPMGNNAELDTESLGTQNLTLRANTSPQLVGSVIFDVDKTVSAHTENLFPYSLTEDGKGDYEPWQLGNGQHTVTGTPYDGKDGGGDAGIGLSITFTITGVDGGDGS